MAILKVLIRLAPIALRVAKAIVVITPHAVTIYQHIKARKQLPSQQPNRKILK